MKIDAELTQQLASQIGQDVDTAIMDALTRPCGYIVTELSGLWQKDLVKEFDQFWLVGQLYIPKRSIRLSSHYFASDVLQIEESPALLLLGIKPRTLTEEYPNKNLDFYFLWGEKIICLVEEGTSMKNLFTHVKPKKQ